MALQSGFNLPASDMAQILEKNDKTAQGIRTWRSLFGNASLANASAMDTLTTSYSDTIAQAYRANLEQENQIMGAGLSSGATKSLLALSRDELQQTYNNYLANYSSALGSVASAYNEEVATIASALGDRANNLSDLYNSAYQYLSEEIYPSTYTDPDGNVSSYLDNYLLDWLYNTDASGTTTLKDWNQIAKEAFDDDGNLTLDGQRFFNAIFNARPEGYQLTDADGNIVNARTFDQWLSDVNPELREWYAGADPFNYTFAGTGKGTALSLLGMDSTVQSPTDSFAGINKFINTQHGTNIPKFKEEYPNTKYFSNDKSRSMEWVEHYFEVMTSSRHPIVADLDRLDREKAAYVNDYNSKIDAKARGFGEQYAQYRDSIKNVLGDTYDKMTQEDKELFDTLDKYIEKMLTAGTYKETELVTNLEDDVFYNDVLKLDELFQEAVNVAEKYYGALSSSGF